jgi:hypothetical protein
MWRLSLKLCNNSSSLPLVFIDRKIELSWRNVTIEHVVQRFGLDLTALASFPSARMAVRRA